MILSLSLRRFLALLFAVPLLACSRGGSDEGKHGRPVVLAAASMHDALEEAADEWADQGHARPVLSFAASSAMARQIEAGAPADLFVSADEAWMDELEEGGFIRDGSRAVMATNALVLIGPSDGSLTLDPVSGFDLVDALHGGRLAVAETESVPAGRYAKAALSDLGVWDSVKDRLAPAENVRAALLLVARGAAPLGVTYATDAASEPRVRVVGTFPAHSHPAIRYPVAMVATSKAAEAADFRDYLLSDAGQAVLAGHGFGPAQQAAYD